jgi:hypothetical protein
MVLGPRWFFVTAIVCGVGTGCFSLSAGQGFWPACRFAILLWLIVQLFLALRPKEDQV